MKYCIIQPVSVLLIRWSQKKRDKFELNLKTYREWKNCSKVRQYSFSSDVIIL